MITSLDIGTINSGAAWFDGKAARMIDLAVRRFAAIAIALVALMIAAVAALPTILYARSHTNFFFGGTSILIMVGVGLDTVKQIESQLQQRHYEGFLR